MAVTTPSRGTWRRFPRCSRPTPSPVPETSSRVSWHAPTPTSSGSSTWCSRTPRSSAPRRSSPWPRRSRTGCSRWRIQGVPPQRPAEVDALVAGVAGVAGVAVARLEGLPHLAALGADRELLRRAARDPYLAAQRHHRRAHHHRLGELVLVDVVAEALVVALVGRDRALLDALVDGGVGQRGETGRNHRNSLRQLAAAPGLDERRVD